MSRFRLEFDTGNAAFAGGAGAGEVARILRRAADAIAALPFPEAGTEFGVYDLNGNRIGGLSVHFPDEEGSE